MSLAGFVLLALELTLKYLYSMKSLNPLLSIQQSLYWYDRWSAFVLDQDHQEFRRRSTACVPVNDMNIVGAFIEALSGLVGRHRSVVDLTADRPLKNRRT